MCDYFILTKSRASPIYSDEQNQVISTNENVYILPKNNLVYYVENGLFEKHLIDWCKQMCSKDKNMLDIGAHSGTYTISLADHCEHVYSFEPQKHTYYSLCGSVALSNLKNVTCLQFGLGSEGQVGKQTLNIVSLDGGGSTLHSNSSTVLRTEDIEIKTLDSLQLENIGFIKMDVEENEYQTLLGSQNTLRRSNYPKILFEMNSENPQLVDFLSSLNYNIINVSASNMFLAEHM